jgi:hypothetical protein
MIMEGVPTGEGRTTVVVAEDDSDGVTTWLSTVDSFVNPSSSPSAPTTADTRTAGAGVPVPGSFQ